MKDELTFGQKRVRTDFAPAHPSPSGIGVAEAKARAAKLIDQAHEIMSNSQDPELRRLCSLAMTDFESGAMWLVKAITR